MFSLLLDIKFFFERCTESRPKDERTLISKIFYNGGKCFATYATYFYLKILRKLRLLTISQLDDSEDLPIVSITSFPARLENVWMVLYSVYKQSYLPGKVIVVLARDEFVNREQSLPDSLTNFLDKGVEILWSDINLRPHNKYVFTKIKYPDRKIITLDDDLIYHYTTIERLLALNQEFPDCICSNRIQKIEYTHMGFTPSNAWSQVFEGKKPSHLWLALGYSGILYPPSFFSKDLFDFSKISKLSLMADDMWLKVQELLSNYMVVSGDYYAHPMTIPNSQKIALQKANDATESRNDKYLQMLYNHYKDQLQQILK